MKKSEMKLAGIRALGPYKNLTPELAERIAAVSFPGKELLSAREIQILLHVVDGALSREIAAKLFLSIKTVEKHRMNSLRKLNVHSATEIVRMFLLPLIPQ